MCLHISVGIHQSSTPVVFCTKSHAAVLHSANTSCCILRVLTTCQGSDRTSNVGECFTVKTTVQTHTRTLVPDKCAVIARSMLASKQILTLACLLTPWIIIIYTAYFFKLLFLKLVRETKKFKYANCWNMSKTWHCFHASHIQTAYTNRSAPPLAQSLALWDLVCRDASSQLALSRVWTWSKTNTAKCYQIQQPTSELQFGGEFILWKRQQLQSQRYTRVASEWPSLRRQARVKTSVQIRFSGSTWTFLLAHQLPWKLTELKRNEDTVIAQMAKPIQSTHARVSAAWQ